MFASYHVFFPSGCGRAPRVWKLLQNVEVWRWGYTANLTLNLFAVTVINYNYNHAPEGLPF